MAKKPSKIFFIVIFSFILIWGIANLTGYFLINEFIKTDYFKDLIVEKLQLKNDANYNLKINARIHWNPFAFGLVVKDSFLNDNQDDNDNNFLNCSIEQSDIKFSIIELVLGNLKPQEIFIKNGNCFIDDRIFQKKESVDNEEEKEKRIDNMSRGIKNLDIKNSVFEFNKKKYFVDRGVIKKKKKKIDIDLFMHNDYAKEFKLNAKGVINYDQWNKIDLDINDLSMKLDGRAFKIFPNIDDIFFKSDGRVEIFLDDLLKVDKINFDIENIYGDFLMKENKERQKILNGEISGNYFDSLKFEKIKLNLDNAEIFGNGEFSISKKLLKGNFNFKDLFATKVTNFWPSTIGQNTKKFYESAIKNGIVSGKVDLLLKFSNEWKFIEKKSRINLNSEIKNGAVLCCGDKFPEIKDIDGKINLTLDDLSGEIKKAKIDDNIDINNSKVSLNFDQQKLFIVGKADATVRGFIDSYEKDYKIEIFGDDILKNIKGDVSSDINLDVDLKNNNKINVEIDIHSKNLSSLLEKNNWKIDQGEIFMKVKNDEMKISFFSNSNSRKISLIGEVNPKKGLYKMEFDEDYNTLRKTFDPIIGHLIQINNRVSGEMYVESIKDNLRMKFDFNLDNAELKAKYLKLDKKIGEKARVTFNLDKYKDDLYLHALDFFSESEKKDDKKNQTHKVKIEDLKYSNDNIFIKNIIINERNLIEKVEFKETKKERDVKVFAKNIFYTDFDWFGFTSDDPNDVSKKISIVGESDKLSFKEDSFFTKISFELLCENGECQKIILNNCKSSDKTKINAAIINDRILIGTNNAGKLLSGIEVTDYVDGGDLRLEGYLNKYKNGKTVMENSLTIKDFNIKNAPIVARILNLASLGGLLSLFTGKGVHFGRFDANFVFFDNKAIFAKSIVDGQAMAIEFEGEVDLTNNKMDLIGSLMPFNFINMILRIIPGLGQVLVGNRGEGLIMVDFGMQGDLKNPIIRVNPMSFFTPYTLRKIFTKEQKQ